MKEVVLPYVQTELMGLSQAADPDAMPLAEYISETMNIFEQQPEAEELLVQRALFFRHAEREDRYDAAFDIVNH